MVEVISYSMGFWFPSFDTSFDTKVMSSCSVTLWAKKLRCSCRTACVHRLSPPLLPSLRIQIQEIVERQDLKCAHVCFVRHPGISSDQIHSAGLRAHDRSPPPVLVVLARWNLVWPFGRTYSTRSHNRYVLRIKNRLWAATGHIIELLTNFPGVSNRVCEVG